MLSCRHATQSVPTHRLVRSRKAALRTGPAAQKLSKRIGRLADSDMVRVNRASLIFLGLPG
jgi:hypothetical protein